MATDTTYVRGADKLKKRIATIRSNLQLPVMVAEIGNLMHRRTLARFDRAVDPNEKPWPELKPATVLDKRRRGFGAQGPLKRTLRLRSAIKVIRGDITGAIFTNTGAGVRIGIDDPDVVPYARVHNRGYQTTKMRRFLGVGALDIKAVDALMRRKAKQLESV